MTEFNPEAATGQFVKRYVAAAQVGKVNNAQLYAGSPMYYYCKHCGGHTETLPESHSYAPKKQCGPCAALKRHGLMSGAMERAKATLLIVAISKAKPPFGKFKAAKDKALKAADVLGVGKPVARSWAKLVRWARGLGLAVEPGKLPDLSGALSGGLIEL